ncbi:hypothetical protein GPA19_23510 [Azoarcus indigens]|nr:DUF6491 family protein [Azoarcus indigens]NMG67915.1 hypothetical protein [Azoarcus indigens]
MRCRRFPPVVDPAPPDRWLAGVFVYRLLGCLGVAAALCGLAQAGGAAAAGPAVATAPAPAAQRPPYARLALAGPPPKALRVFRVYGWHSLDARTGLLWLGVDEPYLIGLRAGCRRPPAQPPSALLLHGRHLQAGRDRLQFGAAACVVDSVQAADRNKLRDLALLPDVIPAIRLVQETPPRGPTGRGGKS